MSAASGDFRGRFVERYKYSVFGQPDCSPIADVNGDGIVDARLDGVNQPQYPGELGQDYYSFTNARDVRWSSTGSGPEDRIGDIRADIDGDGLITKWDELLEQRNRESWWQAGAATITPVIDPVLDDAALRAQAGGLNIDDHGRFDGRGELSVVLPHVQSASGQPITQGTEQTAWRAHRAKSEVMLDNRIGYAGYIWDPWLKVYQVRHRVYMPGTQDGRDVGPSWLQPDPIGIAGGLNLYEYCNGDPMSFVDPMGLRPDWLDNHLYYVGQGVGVVTDGIRTGAEAVGGVAGDLAYDTGQIVGAKTGRVAGQIGEGVGTATAQAAAYIVLAAGVAVAAPSTIVVFAAAGIYGAYHVGGGIFEAITGEETATGRQLTIAERAERYTNGAIAIGLAAYTFKGRVAGRDAHEPPPGSGGAPTGSCSGSSTSVNNSSAPKFSNAGLRAAATGNRVHYDQLNGGTGQQLPSALAQQYPQTTFRFPARGAKGADVEYQGGTHPSSYPGSKWQPGNKFGDFKPNTAPGLRRFKQEIRNGKLPAGTQHLPYDPATGTPAW